MTPLDQLKANLMERQEECRFFSDRECERLLEKHKGDVRAASYEGLLQKAEADGMTLPDGAKIEDSRKYFLSLASYYRPAHTGTIGRADEVGQ
ncbi:MAG: hypothetical protein HFE85_00230 [Clostridiales bacterium]|nr:hypothetical protein [Clostridiales bacterium]